MSQAPPSAWVRRFASLIRPGGHVLDIAAGRGRHSRLFLDMGFRVTAVDRNVTNLQPIAGDRCTVLALDLEAGLPDEVMAPLGTGFDGITVVNYLHRPLYPWLAAALAPGGVLIYETFMLGNERFGHPSNPNFLLRPGELLAAFPSLTVVAFEQGEVGQPTIAVKQRIAAVAGPLRQLPDASA